MNPIHLTVIKASLGSVVIELSQTDEEADMTNRSTVTLKEGQQMKLYLQGDDDED